MPYARGRRPLSPRQRDCAECLSRGLSDAAIADELALAPASVPKLVWATVRRLGAKGRDEAGELYATLAANGHGVGTDSRYVAAQAEAAANLELLAHTLDIAEAAIADVEARCAAVRRALTYPRRVVKRRRLLPEGVPDA